MPRQQELEKELGLWQRRLDRLRQQKALFGATADPGLDIQIEDIEATIEKLRAELAGLRQPSIQPAAARPPAVALPAFTVVEPDPELARLRAKPRLFLCHASEDKEPVKQLYHLLKEAGYRPWLDKFDLLPGQRWRPAIRNIVSDANNLVLVCLSGNATRQGVIQEEIKWACNYSGQHRSGAKPPPSLPLLGGGVNFPSSGGIEGGHSLRRSGQAEQLPINEIRWQPGRLYSAVGLRQGHHQRGRSQRLSACRLEGGWVRSPVAGSDLTLIAGQKLTNRGYRAAARRKCDGYCTGYWPGQWPTD